MDASAQQPRPAGPAGRTRRDRESLPLSAPELIGMVAALMGLNAFSIDLILPALPDIGAAYGLEAANAPQLVIGAYVLGVGLATLFYGPVSDALGRRGLLLGSLGAMLACTLLCAFAPSFWVLLLARVLQGAAAAALRVIAVAVVRDLVQGRRMAEIMSFAMTVFMISPIIAPGVGQLLLMAMDWRAVFVALFVGISAIAIWVGLRLPETLAPENRSPFSLRGALRSYVLVCRNRVSLGYTLASGFVFGGLFAFVATAEQVFAQQYEMGRAFPLAFAGIATGMAIASIFNAKLVGRMGMRRLSHGALIACLTLFILMTVSAAAGFDSFWAFYAPYFVAMFCFGMLGANFNSLVMEPAGHRAGSMASVNGAFNFLCGALLGSLIGQAYDGTILPLAAGNAMLCAAALAIVLVTERGRLFGDGQNEGQGEDRAPNPGDSAPH